MKPRPRSSRDTPPRTLQDYLDMPYRLEIVPGSYGNFVVSYPDLPGCITQVKRLKDAAPAAQEILQGWLELALEDGQAIPLPRQPEEYSGKFVVRITKSLHRKLVEAAEEEGVSLNAYAAELLARGEAEQRAEGMLEVIRQDMHELRKQLPTFEGVPQESTEQQRSRPGHLFTVVAA